VRRADNLTTFMCRLSWNLGTSTSWNPQGLSRLVMGVLFYNPNTSTLFYITSATNTAIRFILSILTDVMIPAQVTRLWQRARNHNELRIRRWETWRILLCPTSLGHTEKDLEHNEIGIRYFRLSIQRVGLSKFT